MFDIGWTELMVIGVVALIVVGPKDLPMMFRKLGQFTAKARGMAREFQRAMDEAADQSGVKDVSRDLRDMTSPRKLGLDALKDATRDAEKPERTKGPATRRLAEERAEKAAKLREVTAARTNDGAVAPTASASDSPAAEPEARESAKSSG
jgi:sec-independent protein translocase protein TatB